MIYHSDIKKFFQLNYDQLTRMALHIIKGKISSDIIVEQLSLFYLSCERLNFINRFDPNKSALSTYVYSALRNSINTLYFRKAKVPQQELTDIIPTEDKEICETLEIDIKDFINTLSTKEKILINECLQGVTPKELSVKYNTTQMTISTNRKILRDKWVAFNNRLIVSII